MEQAKINMRRSSTLRTDKEKLAADDRKDSTNTVPPTPIDAPTDGYLPAAQQGSLQPDPEIPNDAPPSYDEAMASGVPPVETSRRPDYAPPPAGEDEVLNMDEKKGGGPFRRRDS